MKIIFEILNDIDYFASPGVSLTDTQPSMKSIAPPKAFTFQQTSWTSLGFKTSYHELSHF